jgi:hypothetical protein
MWRSAPPHLSSTRFAGDYFLGPLEEKRNAIDRRSGVQKKKGQRATSRPSQRRAARRRQGSTAFVIETAVIDKAVSGRTITVYVPATQFDVQLTRATPFALVIAKELDTMHDGPVAGGVKSTRTPGAGLPVESKTVARIVDPKADA